MKAIILDRDGVINYDSHDYIKSPDEWMPIPGSLEAIARLNQAGYSVFVATNQSGVARKLYNRSTLALIHDRMLMALAEQGGKIEAIFYCPHHPDEDCVCRKPKPGLLQKIALNFNCSLHKTWMIGDTWRDFEAAQSAGCKAMLVKTGLISDLSEHEGVVPIFANLAEAVEAILETPSP